MNFIKNGNTCYITTNNGIIRCDHKKKNMVLFLSNLIVNENERRIGIGGILIDVAINRARSLGCEVVSLEVEEDCQWLTDWYKRLGFICVGYGYQDGMILMTKKL